MLKRTAELEVLCEVILPVDAEHRLPLLSPFRIALQRHIDVGTCIYDALIKANELRYKLMPYIYSVAYKVWRDDYTMMRLLTFDFADDKNVINIYNIINYSINIITYSNFIKYLCYFKFNFI